MERNNHMKSSEEPIRIIGPEHRVPKGLGDTIKKVTDKLGIKQCGGCKKRQDALNRLVPYKKPDKKEG